MFIPLSFVAGTNAILVYRGDDRKPTFHVRTCHEILSENFHFPTQPDPSILYAGSLLRQKPDILRGKSFSNHLPTTHMFHSNGHNHCKRCYSVSYLCRD
jgi:hypothetical protein